jgi:transposase
MACGHPRVMKIGGILAAHSVLVIIYHVLKTGRPYDELGANYFERVNAQQIERHHVKRLMALGYQVTLTPLAPAEPISA